MLFFCISIAAKDEDGASCGQSNEALPTLPPSLYHGDHLQLFGQGKNQPQDHGLAVSIDPFQVKSIRL